MARIIRRLIGALCIITALILTQIPARLTQAASTAKEDFLLDNDTLVKYTGTATTVSVSDDIKYIGEEAFANNQYLGVVNFGKNVKEIRHGAFANCGYLNYVVIPDSVVKVDSAAFSACSNLKNVSIGDNVESFGGGVFAACKNLAGISVSKNNKNLKFEAGVLYDNNKEHIYAYLTANPYEIYYMPNSVKNISPYSFWENEDLEEVYLSSYLENIPAYSFSNCRDLKYVQIPYSVDSIDAKAFENCVSLTDVSIPASVKYIDPTAFDGCTNLNIIADEGTAAYEFFKSFNKSDVANAESQDVKNLVKTIGSNTKNDNSEDSSSNSSNSNSTNNGYIDASQDPSNVDWMPSVNPLLNSDDSSVFGKTIIVDGRAVLFVNRELEVNQISNEELQKQLEESAETANDDGSESVIYDSGKGGYLPKYTYIDGNIASQAYYASDNEEDFIIPSSAKKIGRFSFARSSVKTIVIPEGVETISYGAFYHCDNLESVSIPSTVKTIEAYAFENTPFKAKYSSDTSSDKFYIVGDGILLGYSATEKNVVIPEGVKTISAGCFEDNSTIESVLLPSSLKCIDSDAFRNCKSLSLVTGGANVEKIADRAFMNCPVSSYNIPASVKYVGLRALDFSDTGLDDNRKVIVFEGDNIPVLSYDSTSSRLANAEYRKDALYNVLYAVVKDGISDFENTILDDDSLGFSGVILNLDKDEQGNETGKASVVKNYIYSQEVLDKLPNNIIVNGNEYIIDGKEDIVLATNPYETVEAKKELTVESSIAGVSAYLSNKEQCRKLTIEESEQAKDCLNSAYSLLFGNRLDNLRGYDISLYDEKGLIKIDRLGKSSLYVTIPVDSSNGKYHVISMDEDGQLEEIGASYNDEDKTITFETGHLSYFGIYSTEDENVVLNLKDGKLVKDYRLDTSPDTGDKSLPIYYVASLALVCIGLILILIKKKNA